MRQGQNDVQSTKRGRKVLVCRNIEEEGVVEDGQNFVRNRFLRLVQAFPCRLSPTNSPT